MKRTWFAIIFLLVAAGMCVGEQVYLKSFERELNEKISAAQTALEQNDTSAYEAYASDIKATWVKKNDLLYATCEHAALDSIAVKIRAMPYTAGEEEQELQELRALLYAFFANEKASVANIL